MKQKREQVGNPPKIKSIDDVPLILRGAGLLWLSYEQKDWDKTTEEL